MTDQEKRDLNLKHIAVLVEDGFEQVELTSPRDALRSAGAAVTVIAPDRNTVVGWNHGKKGDTFTVDMNLVDAKAQGFDALLLPGGASSADKLRNNATAVKFARDFFLQHKPVAAICHGSAILAEGDVIDKRKMTSHPDLQAELVTAGADWVDEPVIVDNGLVTSRRPDDLDAFNAKVLEEIAEGRHEKQHA